MQQEEIYYDNEDQLFEIIQEQLSDSEFRFVFKVFSLYADNIISYQEFVLVTQEILLQIDKEILQYLKLSIENREKTRIALSPFDIKQPLKADKGSL